MTPNRIRVSPAKGIRWKNRLVVNALTDDLLALGYEEDGPHVIEGLPQWQLRNFYHLGDSAYAVVLSTESDGAWVEFYCRYAAGRRTYSFTATNTTSPRVGVLDKPPGVLQARRSGAAVKRLHSLFLKDRPKQALLPVSAGGCARALEEAWAHEMDWRNGRGSPTPKEVAKVISLPSHSKGKVRQDLFKELLALLHAVRLEPTHRRKPPKSLTGAVRTGNLDLVRQFLASGYSPDEKTVGFNSPLNPAASRGDLPMLELLLDAGASPHRKGLFSPLINAAKHGHVAVLKRLLKAGVSLASEGPDALAAAAADQQPEAVRCLLEKGVPADANDGRALAAAAQAGCVELLKLLFDAGASNAKAGKALQAAAAAGQFPAAKFLVEQDVNPLSHPQFVTDLYGQKCRKPLLPATLAREEGFRTLADFLNGKPVNEADAIAATPAASDAREKLSTAIREFEEATEGKRFEGTFREGALLRMIEMIRSGQLGKRLNECDGKRRYPLKLAAANGDIEVVQAMLKAGAQPNLPGTRAFGPLQEAACNGHREVVRLLLEAGADPNPKAIGTPPLFGAVEWGDPGIVKLLLDAGADPDVKDNLRQTVFAIDAGLHDKTIKALLKEASQRRKGRTPATGSGILCKRLKKMVNVATARGVQDFKSFFGQPEWAVAMVRAPSASVAKEIAAIVESPRWEQDIAGRGIESVKRSVYVLQLRGSEWSFVLRSLGWIGSEELEKLPKEAATLSRRLKTRVFTYMAEDTSGCEGYEIYENGERVERADWDGSLKFESKLRRSRPRFDESFPDPFFAGEGIYLPACWFEDDGKEAKLGLEGVTPGDVARVDRVVLKD